ncbi:MAG TPA: holo-ACP synthase [Sphingobacteriaceae bacterium]
MQPDWSGLAEDVSRLPGFAAGNDIVFLPDFRAMFNDLFREKAFSENEVAYCEQFDDPILRYASTWAAKEAVYKAVKQLDSTAMGFRGIEILREKPAGMPLVKLHKHGNKFGTSLSLTHDGDYVWAVCLVTAQETGPVPDPRNDQHL